MNDNAELSERVLAKMDMLEILEVLNITVEDIVERFDDRIDSNVEDIEEYLNEQ